jgi:hypothetical protein
LGLATTAQRTPFQRSIKVLSRPELTEEKPTAKQLVELGHAMPVSWLLVTTAAGLATVARAVTALASDPGPIAATITSATATIETAVARPVPRPRRHPARSRDTRPMVVTRPPNDCSRGREKRLGSNPAYVKQPQAQ